jgi:hypothetical protein
VAKVKGLTILESELKKFNENSLIIKDHIEKMFSFLYNDLNKVTRELFHPANDSLYEYNVNANVDNLKLIFAFLHVEKGYYSKMEFYSPVINFLKDENVYLISLLSLKRSVENLNNNLSKKSFTKLFIVCFIKILEEFFKFSSANKFNEILMIDLKYKKEYVFSSDQENALFPMDLICFYYLKLKARHFNLIKEIEENLKIPKFLET